jgi:hypothetical protein
MIQSIGMDASPDSDSIHFVHSDIHLRFDCSPGIKNFSSSTSDYSRSYHIAHFCPLNYDIRHNFALRTPLLDINCEKVTSPGAGLGLSCVESQHRLISWVPGRAELEAILSFKRRTRFSSRRRYRLRIQLKKLSWCRRLPRSLS